MSLAGPLRVLCALGSFLILASLIEPLTVNLNSLFLARRLTGDAALAASFYPLALRNQAPEPLPDKEPRLSPAGRLAGQDVPRLVALGPVLFPDDRDLLATRAQVRTWVEDQPGALADLARLRSLGEAGPWLDLLQGDIYDAAGRSREASAAYAAGHYGPAAERALWNQIVIARSALAAGALDEAARWLALPEQPLADDLTLHYLRYELARAAKHAAEAEGARAWLSHMPAAALQQYSDARLRDSTAQTMNELYRTGLWSPEFYARARAAWSALAAPDTAAPPGAPAGIPPPRPGSAPTHTPGDVVPLPWIRDPDQGNWTWQAMASTSPWNAGAFIGTPVPDCGPSATACYRIDGLWATRQPGLQPARAGIYSPVFTWPAGRSGTVSVAYRTEALSAPDDGAAIYLTGSTAFSRPGWITLPNTAGAWKVATLVAHSSGPADLPLRLYLFLFGPGRVWYGQPEVVLLPDGTAPPSAWGLQIQ